MGYYVRFCLVVELVVLAICVGDLGWFASFGLCGVVLLGLGC